MSSAVVWDIETAPDVDGFARANGLADKSVEEIQETIGAKFPKPPQHSIVCIGAVVAERVDGVWQVRAVGAPHVGERSEKELIRSFLARIDELKPKLVTYNGSAFDLPVLRYRAVLHQLSAPALFARPYFNRFADDALDLCDSLSSFGASTKMRLDKLCKVMGLAGKPADIDGSQVAEYFRAGRIQETADYCVTDVVNTYRLWLRYELFRGTLTEEQFAEADSASALTRI